MKRRLSGWMVGVVFLLVGCGSSDQNDYTVLFEKPVIIMDHIISHRGTPIGTVKKSDMDSGHSARLSVDIDPDYINLLGQNTVFVLVAGRLQLAMVAPFGEPLEPNDVMVGFNSKTDLMLFRLKNLLGNKAFAARKRADRLAHIHTILD